jgi:hypothetical protein
MAFDDILARAFFIFAGLLFWHGTQHLIGTRTDTDPTRITDKIHIWLENWNKKLAKNDRAVRWLLITSTFLLDMLGLQMMLNTIFGPSTRPFIAMLLVCILRQVNQNISAFPTPKGILWRETGVPSIIVSYSVATDFFFSGHTAMAVLGCYELSYYELPWLNVAAVIVAIYEMFTMLLLRAHWSADVYTGFITALWAGIAAQSIAPSFDKFLLELF